MRLPHLQCSHGKACRLREWDGWQCRSHQLAEPPSGDSSHLKLGLVDFGSLVLMAFANWLMLIFLDHFSDGTCCGFSKKGDILSDSVKEKKPQTYGNQHDPGDNLQMVIFVK